MPKYLAIAITFFMLVATGCMCLLSYQGYKLLASARVTVDHAAVASENLRRISGQFTDQDIGFVKRHYVLQNKALLQTIEGGKSATEQLNKTLAVTRSTITGFTPVLVQAERAIANAGMLASTLTTQVNYNGNELAGFLEQGTKAAKSADKAFSEVGLLGERTRLLLQDEIVPTIESIKKDIELTGQLVGSIKVITDKELPAALNSAIKSLGNVELITGDLAAFTKRNLNPDPPNSRLGKIVAPIFKVIKLATAVGQLLVVVSTVGR